MIKSKQSIATHVGYMMVVAVEVLRVFHFDGSKQQNCFKMSK
jgi:hypothetical protein